MNKEFEEKFVTGTCPYDLAIQNDVNELWRWIEQYGTEQRVDENKMYDHLYWNGNLGHERFKNRIKELKDE